MNDRVEKGLLASMVGRAKTAWSLHTLPLDIAMEEANVEGLQQRLGETAEALCVAKTRLAALRAQLARAQGARQPAAAGEPLRVVSAPAARRRRLGSGEFWLRSGSSQRHSGGE